MNIIMDKKKRIVKKFNEFIEEYKNSILDNWTDGAIEIIQMNYLPDIDFYDDDKMEIDYVCDNFHKFFNRDKFKKDILNYVRPDLQLRAMNNKLCKEIWEKYKK